MNPMDMVLQLGAWGQQHPQAFLAGALGIPMLLGGTHALARWSRGDQTTHGSARWASLREVRKAHLVDNQGVIAGRLHGKLLADNSETHVLLMGPTRSGKGVGTIIPTLLTWKGSALILDPKDGENAEVTAPWRATQGDVALFTPCKAPSTRINILDTIRLRSNYEMSDALLIAQSLVAPEKLARESNTGTHFRELAAMLLTASILHVCYCEERKSLAGVWYFLTQAHDNLATCLDVMSISPHHHGSPHGGIASLVAAIRNIAGDRELSSVWSTAIRPLSLYNDPLIAASTDSSSIDLNNLQYAERPLSLYLIAPSPLDLERLHPLYRVILDVAMTRLMQHKVRTWKHRLLFCGDELPWYGYVRAVDKGIAVMAGYGIKCLLVTQDLPSLEEVYGQHTAIWGNTDLKILHSPTNDITAKRISENLIGKGTVSNPVESRQAGLFGQHSVSMQSVARPLLTTDEVMELPADKVIVRRSGCKPILATKVNYRYERFFQRRAYM